MRPALTLCLLCQAFWPRPGGGEHPTADRAGCSASGACYSLHHATIKREAAQEACSLRGGMLSTGRGGAELSALLALLRAGPGPGGGSKDLVFWVALERGRSHCTLENEPLRGFSWLFPDAATGSEEDTLPWVKEPLRSCTARRCAGLQAARGVEPAGWKETRCHVRASGYLCKYKYRSACPAPRPGAATGLSYRAPFQLHSPALAFSPPGTQVSATCPGGRFVTATCTEEEVGARWDGLPSGAVLCPCPGRYLLAGTCSELSNCLDNSGDFVCECAPGFELGEDDRSCVPRGEGGPASGGPGVPASHQPPTAASPVPKRRWSPQEPKNPGEKYHGPGSSAASVPETPQWGAQSTRWSPHTSSEATWSPPGSLIPKLDATPSSSAPQAFDSSSTVVFVLVSIAIVVLVILTMTVLGLFKLCFQKSASSRPRKGPLGAPRGTESDTESAALRAGSSHCTDKGVKVTDGNLRSPGEGAPLAGASPASWVT
ncbi:C-type lectin domain family 14 member A [Ctenodactylus gundi]